MDIRQAQAFAHEAFDVALVRGVKSGKQTLHVRIERGPCAERDGSRPQHHHCLPHEFLDVRLPSGDAHDDRGAVKRCEAVLAAGTTAAKSRMNVLQLLRVDKQLSEMNGKC